MSEEKKTQKVPRQRIKGKGMMTKVKSRHLALFAGWFLLHLTKSRAPGKKDAIEHECSQRQNHRRTLMPCEYGPAAAGALSVAINSCARTITEDAFLRFFSCRFVARSAAVRAVMD